MKNINQASFLISCIKKKLKALLNLLPYTDEPVAFEQFRLIIKRITLWDSYTKGKSLCYVFCFLAKRII